MNATDLVVEEVMQGNAISLVQAARLIPATKGKSKHINQSTVWRWALQGAKNRVGQQVRLECIQVGRVIATTPQAVQRFIMALNAIPVLSVTFSQSCGEVQQAFFGGADFCLGQPGT